MEGSQEGYKEDEILRMALWRGEANCIRTPQKGKQLSMDMIKAYKIMKPVEQWERQ